MWTSKSPSSHQNLLMLIFLSFFIDMLQLPFQQPRCEALSHPGQQGAYLRDQRCGALSNSLASGISFQGLCWLSAPHMVPDRELGPLQPPWSSWSPPRARFPERQGQELQLCHRLAATWATWANWATSVKGTSWQVD